MSLDLDLPPASSDGAAAQSAGPQERDGYVPLFAGVRWRRLLKSHVLQDGVLATLLTAVALMGVVAHLDVDLPEGGDGPLRALDTVAVLLILLQTAPLIWRRSAPVLVLAITTSAMLALSLAGYQPSFASMGFLIALYSVAAHRTRRTSIKAGIAVGGALLLMLAAGTHPVEPDTIIVQTLMVGGAWFLGDAHRAGRNHMAALRDRAVLLELQREQQTREAVLQERRVIARELHDVIAHNVSVIVAQAGAAQRISRSHPDRTLITLRTIEQAGREALVEMRRLMGVLRTDVDQDQGRAPHPGLRDLDALAEHVRRAGIPVTLTIELGARPLPPGLDLSAYRIVQEALTNVLKHAGPSRAEVIVRTADGRLHLTVLDDGPGVSRPQGGPWRPRFGHLGMRERVALFGGELHVGPRAGGGYQVDASLPLDGESLPE